MKEPQRHAKLRTLPAGDLIMSLKTGRDTVPKPKELVAHQSHEIEI